MGFKKNILLCLAGFSYFISFSQGQIRFQGMVMDSLKNPLAGTNITAIPEETNIKVLHEAADSLGNFDFLLEKGKQYTIILSHLGYFTKKVGITASPPLQNVFTLQERLEKLKEVIINYTSPITSKKDTTIYDVDAFASGEERKLREIIKKLPGIEVDRDGNLTAKGKKVSKVLVENQTFFTGDSKLAVNNIPADVVDKIEVIQNYSDIGFLKGLEDTNDVALNISLKEGKKKFVFGDIEVAAGTESRYLAHPSIFYYSPKTTLNFIGDVNDIGLKSFKVSDYINFEGGFGKLFKDAKAYGNLIGSDFSKFLRKNDFKENSMIFSALHGRKSISKKTEMSAYIIWNDEIIETEKLSLNTYNNNDTFLEETRTSTNNFDNSLILGKLNLNYAPSIFEDLSLNSFIKIANDNSNGAILTNSILQDNSFATLNNSDNTTFRQNASYNKRFSKAQTITVEGTFSYLKNNLTGQWLTDEAFLEGLIPLRESQIFNVNREQNTERYSLDLASKDYWVINNYNHLYFSLGANLLRENFSSSEKQLLENGNVNDFSNVGFGNDLDFSFNDMFAGLEYKFLLGIFTVKSGLSYHNYVWKTNQFSNEISNEKNAFLPLLKIDADFSDNENLSFNYRANVRFPVSSRLFSNFLLNSFNRVQRGNPNLLNERYSTFSLNYSKFSLYRGLQIIAGIGYNKKTNSIKSSTTLQGIEQFTTFEMLNRPENNLKANFIFGKKMGNIRITLESSAGYSEFFQLINNNTKLNLLKDFSSSFKINGTFKKWPNFEVGYTYEPTQIIAETGGNKFINSELFVDVNYNFFKDFTLKFDFSSVEYANKTQNLVDIYQLANASIFYRKEDSPWGFEISSTNLFDTRFRRQNSFSDFLTIDQTIFVMPRITLLKISYKL